MQNCFIHRKCNCIFRRRDIFDQHLAECEKAVDILREGVQGMERPKPNIPQISVDEIVESKAIPCEDQVLAFRNWYYAEIREGFLKVKMN